MMKKTVIKRAAKLWPKTARLDAAVHHLNTEADEGLPAIDNSPEPVIPATRMKIIRAVAGEAIQKFNENDEYAAYEAVSFIDDSEEKLALWSILKPHSALRSAIKRLAAEERAGAAKLASEAEQKEA